MIPPTSIDGTDITGATIDGQDVQEITVDGDTVFEAQQVVRGGDKLYWSQYNLNVEEYDLSTPWDVSTATDVNSVNIDKNVSLSHDGTHIIGQPNQNLRCLTLSTPFDLSSANLFYSISRFNGSLSAVEFANSGNLFYYGDTQNGTTIEQYSLTTPFDIRTRSLDYTETFPHAATSISVTKFGTYAFVTARPSAVYIYEMSTPFDLTTKTQISSASPAGDLACGVMADDGSAIAVSTAFGPSPKIQTEDLSTPFDLSTRTNTNTDILGYEPWGITAKRI